MVWFQCEDCGENLKKPKLLNHFRICSAFKFSCIDCNQIFGQDSVQEHTQCITEAEKYGPKGNQGKASNGTTPKSNNKSTKGDIDINVGLSDRPPWFCSICNTKATSKQTLLLHADGKKHRAKARAINAAKLQQTKQTEGPAATENAVNGVSKGSKEVEEQRMQDTQVARDNTEADNVKKRKLESLSNGSEKKTDSDIPLETTLAEGKESRSKKVKQNEDKDSKVISVSINKKIKLKKLIKSALKTNPDGVLTMKKLKKLVLKSLQESGRTEDEKQLNNMIEQKINTSSRFRVDNKYVHLAAKG